MIKNIYILVHVNKNILIRTSPNSKMQSAKCLGIIILALIFFIILLYQLFLLLEEKVLFVPDEKHIWSPDNSYRDIYFGEPKLHAWYFPINDINQPIILFCHGNIGNISYRRYVVDLCREINLSLFLFDYQGYGSSKGKATLDNIKRDGETAYNYLLQLGYSPDKIIVWGESLGGLVATHITAKYSCHRLLLLATFSDLSSLASQSTGFVGKVAYPFLIFQGESNLERIKRTNVPVLIIHSSEDEIIPYTHAEELYHNINHPWKSLITIHGKHATPYLTPEVIEEVMRFCWQSPQTTPYCLDILSHIAQK